MGRKEPNQTNKQNQGLSIQNIFVYRVPGKYVYVILSQEQKHLYYPMQRAHNPLIRTSL